MKDFLTENTSEEYLNHSTLVSGLVKCTKLASLPDQAIPNSHFIDTSLE